MAGKTHLGFGATPGKARTFTAKTAASVVTVDATTLNPFPKTFSQNASNWQRLVLILKNNGIL